MRLLLVGTAGMPPTTLAMDTREEDEEEPEVVEEEKDESKDGVPFFTGDWIGREQQRWFRDACPAGGRSVMYEDQKQELLGLVYAEDAVN